MSTLNVYVLIGSIYLLEWDIICMHVSDSWSAWQAKGCAHSDGARDML